MKSGEDEAVCRSGAAERGEEVASGCCDIPSPGAASPAPRYFLTGGLLVVGFLFNALL